MFTRKICLRLYETDATGVLYFPQQLRIAQETFECYLEAAGTPLAKWLEENKYLLPVVHAEADYCKPIQVGDEVEIRLTLAKIGESSFTLSTEFVLPGDIRAGTTSIVHVVIDRKIWKSCPIPKNLHECLQQLALTQVCK